MRLNRIGYLGYAAFMMDGNIAIENICLVEF